MELMSSVLFCTLLALLPQALDATKDRLANTSSLNWLSDPMIDKHYKQKKILINFNGVRKANPLHDVFMDSSCHSCTNCMEKAIKALVNYQNIVMNNKSNAGELHLGVIGSKINWIHRLDKRDVKDQLTTKLLTKAKSKEKKSKSRKSVTVTKFKQDGEVFALKVKEVSTPIVLDSNGSNADILTSVSSCQVYKIKKYFPCNSPDGNLLLTLAKKKGSKKGAKKDSVRIASTTSTAVIEDNKAVTEKRVQGTRKRNVDNTQVVENFMPSIELY